MSASPELNGLSCRGCGDPLVGRQRVWCSDYCRRGYGYGGTCDRCGAELFHVSGYVTEYCFKCRSEVRREDSRERIIDAIRDWHRRYGEVPAASDWNVAPSQIKRRHPELRAKIMSRHRDRSWPGVSDAQNAFGSWNEAIKAAGLMPRPLGIRKDVESWKRHLVRHG